VRLCWLRPPETANGAADGGAAGVIDDLGSGVPAHRLGMPVWLLACHGGRVGADTPPARWRVLPSAHAVELPDAVPIDAGACLGPTALAAMLAVQANGGVAGQRVLVEDGASQWGHYALQFARLGGAALVLARVASPIASGLALDDGAHATLQGRAADAKRHLAELTQGAGIDRVIAADAARTIDIERLGAAPLARALCQLQAWLERGLVRHRVAARLPLARIGEVRALQRATGDGYAAVLLALD
jgi:NADPH:quinone reductase